jgi:hypothetical protein
MKCVCAQNVNIFTNLISIWGFWPWTVKIIITNVVVYPWKGLLHKVQWSIMKSRCISFMKSNALKGGKVLKFDQEWNEDVRHWFKSDGSIKDLYDNILSKK